MSAWMVAFVGVIYLVTCVSLWLEGKPSMAVVFFGYALSNVGFYFAIK